MTFQRRVSAGAAILATGRVAGQGCALIRNIMIARLIGPEDFGIVATLAITVSLVEMVSDVACDKLLIQAENGDDPRLQKAAQFLLAARGLFLAAVLWALAWPVSKLFDVSQARWAFWWLAVVPIIRGLVHLDVKRMHRDMRFGPFVVTDTASEFAVTLAAWPLAAWLGDYSVALWLIIAQATVMTIGTHLLAERRYAWAVDLSHLRSLFRFGWPLMINGLFMYLITCGLQAIVGATYSMTELGMYSVAVALTSAPTLLMFHVGGTVLLPILSRLQGSRERFLAYYEFSAQVFALASAAVAAPFIIAGGLLVVTLYGAKYAEVASFIGLLAVAQAVYMLRGSVTVAAIALGDTKNMMISNSFRATGLLGALATALAGGSLTWIAASAFAGEVVGLSAAVFHLQRYHAVPAGLCFRPACVAVGIWIAAAGMLLAGAQNLGWFVAAPVCVLLAVTTVIAMVLAFPRFRRRCQNLVFG